MVWLWLASVWLLSLLPPTLLSVLVSLRLYEPVISLPVAVLFVVSPLLTSLMQLSVWLVSVCAVRLPSLLSALLVSVPVTELPAALLIVLSLLMVVLRSVSVWFVSDVVATTLLKAVLLPA